jgi:catechol 1,2-dioxygenase
MLASMSWRPRLRIPSNEHDLATAALDRRRLLLGAATLGGSFLWPGCGRPTAPVPPEAGAPPASSAAASTAPPTPNVATAASSAPAASSLAATRTCVETHDNIEGPYYRTGAPVRSSLADAGAKGTPLIIEGNVFGLDCASPIADAELDVWHATTDGHYDNDGTLRVARGEFLLRGRIRTDAQGRYELRTIVPGRYLNGAQFRPAHVHVKLSARGFTRLTTQLYFPDDPYNRIDPFIHPSLVMATANEGDVRRARFDFVLRRT